MVAVCVFFFSSFFFRRGGAETGTPPGSGREMDGNGKGGRKSEGDIKRKTEKGKREKGRWTRKGAEMDEARNNARGEPAAPCCELNLWAPTPILTRPML